MTYSLEEIRASISETEKLKNPKVFLIDLERQINDIKRKNNKNGLIFLIADTENDDVKVISYVYEYDKAIDKFKFER